jgi:hypothetical protein
LCRSPVFCTLFSRCVAAPPYTPLAASSFEVRSANHALVSFICILSRLRTQISRSICNFIYTLQALLAATPPSLMSEWIQLEWIQLLAQNSRSICIYNLTSHSTGATSVDAAVADE